MKQILMILILAFFSFSLNAQIPQGCVKEICVPASYKKTNYTQPISAVTYSVPKMKQVTETIPAITAQRPIMKTITETICTKEGAIEYVFECDPSDPKVRELCRKVIEPTFEEISYSVPSGEYEEILVQAEQVVTYMVPSGDFELNTEQEATIISKEVELKIANGFITTAPCDNSSTGAVLSINSSTTPETCSRLATLDGTATAEYNPEFKCLWSTGETSPTISKLKSGDYSVTVTASDGRSTVANVKVGDLNICN